MNLLSILLILLFTSSLIGSPSQSSLNCESSSQCKSLTTQNYQDGNFTQSIQYFNKWLNALNSECENNNSSSCERLALIYLDGSFNVLKNEREAFILYDRACKLDGATCFNLVQFYKSEKYKKKTLKSLDQACNLGEGQACNMLAKILKDKNSLEKAKKTLIQDCNKLKALSCRYLGDIKLLDKKQNSELESIKLYDKACNLGDLESCEGFSAFYNYDSARAKIKKLYKNLIKKHSKDCTTEAAACLQLAQIYIKENINKVFEALQSACLLDPKECINAALAYDIKQTKKDLTTEKLLKNEEKAEFFYKKAEEFYSNSCQENDINSCIIIANLYEMQNKKYLSFYEKACSLKDAKSCEIIANIYTTNNKIQEAQEVYKKILDIYTDECNQSKAAACKKLGDIYSLKDRPTINTKINVTKANKFYKKACNLHNIEACNEYIKISR